MYVNRVEFYHSVRCGEIDFTDLRAIEAVAQLTFLIGKADIASQLGPMPLHLLP